mmetsp:Transcript_5054/g.14709  ORF Transcript_5054/g.14709 Transcript_5054/m.14709 type:complete len:256 (-) Transcript_5054:46-813(-)
MPTASIRSARRLTLDVRAHRGKVRTVCLSRASAGCGDDGYREAQTERVDARGDDVARADGPDPFGRPREQQVPLLERVHARDRLNQRRHAKDHQTGRAALPRCRLAIHAEPHVERRGVGHCGRGNHLADGAGRVPALGRGPRLASLLRSVLRSAVSHVERKAVPADVRHRVGSLHARGAPPDDHAELELMVRVGGARRELMRRARADDGRSRLDEPERRLWDGVVELVRVRDVVAADGVHDSRPAPPRHAANPER